MSIPRLSPKEALILRHLVSKGAAYGLELVRESEGQLKRGTVYVTLGRMADKGLVESEEVPRNDGTGLNSRVFRATGRGARVLKALELASASMALAWEGA
jgi:PadR family transcriptional regulator, regulatory protein PadR